MDKIWDRLRSSPGGIGALLGAGFVCLGLVAALLIRDLVLVQKTCPLPVPSSWEVSVISAFEWQRCLDAIKGARAGLPWEVVGLLVIGGLLGKGIINWRQHNSGARNLLEAADVWRRCTEAGIQAREGEHYGDGESHLLDALRESEKFGQKDSRVGESLMNLGLLYSKWESTSLGCLYIWAWRTWKEARGPKDLSVALDLKNLAAACRDEPRRFAEAEPLLRRAVKSYEGALGLEHPTFAWGLFDLAYFYDLQGRYNDAQPLYQRSLEILEKVLGPNHPDAYMVRKLIIRYP